MTKRLRLQVFSLLVALATGAGVVLLAGFIGASVYERQCLPDEECWALLGGLMVGVIATGLTAAITVVALALVTGAGVAFGVGAAIAFLLAAAAGMVWFEGWTPVLGLGAALALVGAFALGQPTGTRKRPVAILLAVAVLAIAGYPVGKRFYDVRQVQQSIESLIERPLQPDLADSELWSVNYGTKGVGYSVHEPERTTGKRPTDVEVELRVLRSAPSPCTGFADLAPAATKDCTELQPGVWRGRAAHKAHFWVRGDDGQWAHVVAGHHLDDKSLQGAHDARAEQVARSLKPGSAWPLAAAVTDCKFCAWPA